MLEFYIEGNERAEVDGRSIGESWRGRRLTDAERFLLVRFCLIQREHLRGVERVLDTLPVEGRFGA